MKRKSVSQRGIQFVIAVPFTIIAVACLLLLAFLFYNQFTKTIQQTTLQESTTLVNQIALNINNYTTRIRGISNSMYYNVIKKADLAEKNLATEMSLFYHANPDAIVSIALYDEQGALLAAAPNASPKKSANVAQQEWFQKANQIIENPHFSLPHVQNLFAEQSQKYNWVISLSRMAELTNSGKTSRGVLLIDTNFSAIEMIFKQLSSTGDGYVYLIDRNGEIIYHPKQQLIHSGLFEENNLAAAQYPDGTHQEVFQNAQRTSIVKTVSYTGWKIVSVVPNRVFTINSAQAKGLIFTFLILVVYILSLVNAALSSQIAKPIQKLESSVSKLDEGSLDLTVYVGGPYEIERLGRTIQKTVTRMKTLTDALVEEQKRLRRSELDALQAQINPHFLYNTLDSIVWMIECDRQKEATTMVTALASLFRIALSGGQTLIPIKTELQHAQHYLHIQNIRYKNKFTVQYDIDPAVQELMIIKLVVQPILENAIYHAMEVLDGEGEICVRAGLQGDVVQISICDNGYGMTPEKVHQLLTEKRPTSTHKKGSGIGLKNVDSRVKLFFGAEYGVSIQSELDEGTTVTISIPSMTAQQAAEKEASL